MEEKKWTFNVHDGQVNIANDNATIYATQNKGVGCDELDKIIRGIVADLPCLKKEEADEIRDVLEMVKDELEKTEPKAGRLRNCVTLIAPMITIANGIPSLANNLQRLTDYIAPYIHL